MLKYCVRNLLQVWNINQPKYICFPTNTYVNSNGLCYLFGKCFQVIKDDFPDIHLVYANMLKNGNDSVDIIKVVGYNILLSFPTRYHWKKYTNLQLMKKSIGQLYVLQQDGKLLNDLKIYLPLQVDGYVDFNRQEMIQQLAPYLQRIKNLEIILL